MSDEGKLNTQIARQARAEALLRDEMLVEALEKIDAEYVKAFRETTANDAVARERIWALMWNLQRFRAHLKSVVDNGKLAQKELEEISKGERRKLFGVV